MIFDVVIGTPDYEVDMKSGLDTLQGVSDTTRTIAEALLTGEVPQRKTAKSDVRTTLKKSFKGSYGQTFRLDILDDELKREYRKIGSMAFAELMTYFMKEALYLENDDLSDKAQKIFDKLGATSEKLVRQLRVSSMENIHEVSTKFDHEVEFRYRKSFDNRITLAKFNKTTALALQAKPSDETLELVASIRRLNTNTGNGRLQLKDGDETVAFGFSSIYRNVRLATKKKFSSNLHYNNGTDRDNWQYLEIKATPIRLQDGRIIKYIVKGFLDE